MTGDSPAQLTGCWPCLIVSDLATNIEFFCGKLGFQLGYHEPELKFAMLVRDQIIFLLRGTDEDASVLANARFHPETWDEDFEPYDVSVSVDDVDALFGELLDRGAEPAAVEVRPYGRDTSVRLPDGYVLVFLQQ